MNPLAVAVQGLGFGAAMAALQGLLLYVVKPEVCFSQLTERRVILKVLFPGHQQLQR
jgi:hypothetical protein